MRMLLRRQSIVKECHRLFYAAPAMRSLCWLSYPATASTLAAQQRSPAAPRTAVAGMGPLQCRCMAFVQDEVVIVGEFLTPPDRAPHLDEYAPLFLHRLAIRLTRVIDPARRAAAMRGVDHDLVIDREQHGVRRIFLLLAVAQIGFVMADAFARVLDQARPPRQGLEREYAAAMDG